MKLRALILFVLGVCVFAWAGPVLALPDADCQGVFFSEYIEGSSNNKALEIFNGYGTALGLSNYRIRIYFNGSTTAGTTINLVGTLAAGDVFVVADNDAAAPILAVTDQTSTASFFNGDDAVELSRIDTGEVIDVIGQVGTDPGDYYGSGAVTTLNQTLRRKFTVTSGDADGTDAFDPALEWDGFAQDTFTDLGVFAGVDRCTPTAIRLRSLAARSGMGSPAVWGGLGLLAAGALVLLRGRVRRARR